MPHLSFQLWRKWPRFLSQPCFTNEARGCTSAALPPLLLLLLLVITLVVVVVLPVLPVELGLEPRPDEEVTAVSELACTWLELLRGLFCIFANKALSSAVASEAAGAGGTSSSFPSSSSSSLSQPGASSDEN